MTRAEETAFADTEVRGMIVNMLEALVALATGQPRQSVDRLATCRSSAKWV